MSRSTKRVLLSGACALALLANGATGVIAQQRDKQPLTEKVLREGIEQDRIMIAPAVGGADVGPHAVVLGEQGDGFSFTYLSSDMPFESKIVKGAPYSAEAVSETTQVLSDGNRITRKTTAQIYRDSEGRTRRDQTATPLGPFATAEESPQTVFINDPVAGVNYVLNARTRTAHKAMQYSFHIRRVEGELKMSQDAAVDHQRRMSEVAAAGAAGTKPVVGGILNSRAKNGPPPVYPPVAKAARAEGRVVVEVVVNEAGQVESASAVEGHPLLRAASVDAARQWEFAPTRLQGKPVKVTGKITFNFVLSKEEQPAAVSAAAAPPEGQMRMRVGGEQHMLPSFQKSEKEALGKQSFDGVEAEGTRNTVTIPAGAIGNERPILIVSERWYSAELQAVVMSRHSDPRFGETSYRLTNINRAEPDRTLFEVPAGYNVTTDGPFERRALPVRKLRTDQ